MTAVVMGVERDAVDNRLYCLLVKSNSEINVGEVLLTPNADANPIPPGMMLVQISDAQMLCRIADKRSSAFGSMAYRRVSAMIAQAVKP